MLPGWVARHLCQVREEEGKGLAHELGGKIFSQFCLNGVLLIPGILVTKAGQVEISAHDLRGFSLICELFIWKSLTKQLQPISTKWSIYQIIVVRGIEMYNLAEPPSLGHTPGTCAGRRVHPQAGQRQLVTFSKAPSRYLATFSQFLPLEKAKRDLSWNGWK